MKISERLSDYGLIGGFFWMLQAIIIWLTVLSDDASWTSDLEQLRVTVNNFPNAAFSVLVALFGTAGLISVFATGLVLDLLSSSFFRTIEMYIFVKHARRHRHWFQRVADANSAYIQEDLTVLLTHPSLKHFLNTSGLKIWTKQGRRQFFCSLPDLIRLRATYARLQSFLLVYVQTSEGVDKVELLSTQINLWNSSRTIAVILVIFAIELPFSGVAGFYDSFALIIALCSMGSGITVALSAFERLCRTLFALTYIVSEREVRDRIQQSPNGSTSG